MYGKELFQKGIYGVKDLIINKIIYIGSTNISFMYRWGQHANNLQYKNHCNKQLTELFNSGNFEFTIIEAGEFTNKELLEKEKYYTEKYDVFENGYCAHVGGGALKPAYIKPNNNFEESDRVNNIRKYIEQNWFNKKIYKEDKTTMESYFKTLGINMTATKFMILIRKTGFIIQRFADKKSWQITGRTF